MVEVAALLSKDFFNLSRNWMRFFEAEKSVLIEVQFRVLRLVITLHLIGLSKVHPSYIDELLR